MLRRLSIVLLMVMMVSFIGCGPEVDEVKEVRQIEDIYMNYKNRRATLMETKNAAPDQIKTLVKEMLNEYDDLQPALDAGLDDGTDKARELQRHGEPLKAAWDSDQDDTDALMELVKRELSN